MFTPQPKRILIAPLDWGLGHTTRCIPLISHILALGHTPVVAGNASQTSFIEEIFGGIEIIELKGYNISYSAWNKWAQAGLLRQMPGILKTIKEEHGWLLQNAPGLRLDGIISDNRYGLWHGTIPSVVITHQLGVRSGLGPVTDRAVQQLHYQMLGRFGTIWVPDLPGTPGLGGALSHPTRVPANTKYIGLLSRFAGLGGARGQSPGTLLILLSGPEPQRTALSQLLWRQAINHPGEIIFVEGTGHAAAPAVIPPHITYHKRLNYKQLLPLMQQAALIVCRSGYSTLMDLVALQKKAILIPTPGQTEQQYLGRQLHARGVFCSMPQRGFELENAVREAGQFPFHPLEVGDAFDSFKAVLGDWVSGL